MEINKFWGIFFSMMAIAYIIKILLIAKGYNINRSSIINKLFIASLPVFLIIMLLKNDLPLNIKIFNIIIGIISILAGIGSLYVKKRIVTKLGIQTKRSNKA